MDFATIANLRKYLSVKESTPGRIEIQFSMSIMGDTEAMKLVQSPPKLSDAVTDTNVNLFSRTLSMDYDVTRISPELLEELISTTEDDRASCIVEELGTALES